MATIPVTQPDGSVQTTPTDTNSLTLAIINAVTHATGSEPTTPLYGAIDPDAFDDLYERATPKVDFEYAGTHVTIHPDKTITVESTTA